MTAPRPIRVLWVDPNATQDSPSMKNVLASLPVMRERGLEIEVWCLRSDAPRDQVTVHELPAAAWMGIFENSWFVLVANLYFILRSIRAGGRPADVVYTTGAYCLFADVVHVHFDSAAWLQVQARLEKLTLRGWMRRQITRLGAVFEWMSWHSPWGKRCIAVSEGLAGSLRGKVPAGKEVRVLSNGYDSRRFHPGVRDQWRAGQRETLGFSPEVLVFLFVATGHLQRKGFWSMLRVLKQLRLNGHRDLHLLVVGGREALWQDNESEMAQLIPDHHQWIKIVPYAREVERYYAAADAFIFPSHFEACALVGLEALACGLPLFLTAYWGHEMYLRPGVNGWLLPWDEAGMVKVIHEALEARPWRLRNTRAEQLDRPAYAHKLADQFHELALSAS